MKMRMAFVLALTALAIGAAAQAQEFGERFTHPTYYVVGPLPAGETLTIRAEPSASSAAVGELKEGDGPIEVVRVSRTGATEWAEIIVDERNRYVAARYLDPAELATLDPSDLPIGARCGGTEPFWDVDIVSETKATWMDFLTGEDREVDISRVQIPEARGGLKALIPLSAEEWSADLLVDAGWCSDGMSDRDYAWRATLILFDSPDHRVMLEGCCWLPPKE